MYFEVDFLHDTHQLNFDRIQIQYVDWFKWYSNLTVLYFLICACGVKLHLFMP